MDIFRHFLSLAFAIGVALAAHRAFADSSFYVANTPDKEAVATLIGDLTSIPGQDYRIGRHEVTQEQWEALMGTNPAYFQGADHPVENVSLDDCLQFCERLNTHPSTIQAGLFFRLPTKAEWQLAAYGGGDLLDSPYGAILDGSRARIADIAWFSGNSEGKTHPIGTKVPNAFGIYDMAGNVSEWTCSPEPSSANHLRKREENSSQPYHVMGGNWFSLARYNEVWFDLRCYPREKKIRTVGLRLVAELRDDSKTARFEVDIPPPSSPRAVDSPAAMNADACIEDVTEKELGRRRDRASKKEHPTASELVMKLEQELR